MLRAIRRSALVFAFLLLLAASGPTAAPDGPTGARPADVLAKFDAYAESSRQRCGGPGMAIAVIQGGTPGSKSVAGFTPESDLGVVVLTNLENTELPEALMFYLQDLYYGRPERDYAGDFLHDSRARLEAGKFPTAPARPAAARDLAAYTGTYTHPHFGKLTAQVRDGALALDLGTRPLPIRTRRWDGDTFAISVPGYGAPK